LLTSATDIYRPTTAGITGTIEREFHPISFRWSCPIATGKRACCNSAALPERTDVSIFWDTHFTIIEKDGTERPATAPEEAWIGRFKKHHKRDKSTKFKKIGGILCEYRCAACNEEV
jgi:hypothetical protein